MSYTINITRQFDPFGDRLVLRERFLQLPGLNADLASATEAVREPVNNNFEVLGTNMTSALATAAAGGGVTLTTAGASADGFILLPHLDTKQTSWSGTKFNTLDQVAWRTRVKTGASIADLTLALGLKLTNTTVLATDADQAFFRYAPATNGGRLQFCYSISGTDYEYDLGVDIAVSTTYELAIAIDENRKPFVYVNGDLLFASNAALTTDIDLIPYIAGLAGAGAAKALTVRAVDISKADND